VKLGEKARLTVKGGEIALRESTSAKKPAAKKAAKPAQKETKTKN